MRFCALPVLALLIPACSGDTADPVERLPDQIADADYTNGHPLARNVSVNPVLEADHFAAVNAWRVSQGLPEFARCDSLDAIARAYSQHMGIEPFFGHTAPEGGDLGDRVYAASGVVMVYSAENLMSTNDGSALACLSAFLASPAHRANLSSTVANTLGVGIWHDGARYLVTHEFVWR